MKIFAVYLRLNLTSKPVWFDDLRINYSSTSILHMTLVQARYVDESRIQNLKDWINDILEKNKFSDQDRNLVFSKSELEEEADGQYLLMSFIEENKPVTHLQKTLLEALKGFDNYCSEDTKEYESNFRPHLTVADQIDLKFKDEVMKYISKGYKIEGRIRDLILAIVGQQTVAESEDSDNWTVFTI